MSRQVMHGKLGNAFFDIAEKPIRVDGQVVPDRKAIVNLVDKNVVGIVGKQYQPVSNRQVYSHFKEICSNAGVDIEPGNGFLIRGGSKTIMEITFPKLDVSPTKNDLVKLNGYLINGFDGFSSAKFVTGAIRLVCSNGLIIGQTEMVVSYRHVGQVNEKLVEQFRMFISSKLQTAKGFISTLRGCEFDNETMAKGFIDENKWIGKKYSELIVQEWMKVKRTLNFWLLYNCFTYIIQHVMKINQENRINQLRRLNQSFMHQINLQK